jgi:hypothetical protein
MCATKSLEKQEAILQHLGMIQADNESLRGKVDKLPTIAEGFGSSVVEYLSQRLSPSNHDEGKDFLRQDLVAAIYGDHETSGGINSSAFHIPEPRKQSLQKGFIEQLRYNGMQDRELRIAEAHEKTFRWIFEDGDNLERPGWNLKDWLESDDQLYWITGKAGSGKSTLMKFISQPVPSTHHSDHLEEITPDQPRCAQYLRKWSGEKPLIIASFYFWAAGSQVQMSQSGMFLSLLYQILEKCPEAIPFVSPGRWEALCLFSDDPKGWTEEELCEMLRVAVLHVGSIANLCLFVDGLDEFDGKHDQLLCLFKDLVSHPAVKICTASRPWIIFEDSFKHKPNLMLEDLTYSDIKEYVTSKFHEDPNFAQLQRREAVFAGQLIEDIVKKASGVFLWVHLVVASLLAGMGYGDRVSDLQRRLDLLPPDLENLYEKILNDLDPFYFEHAVQYFQIMRSSVEPPPILLFSFADDEDAEFAIRLPIKPLSEEEVMLRIDTMRRRVNSRCKGLLEVDRGVRDVEFTNIFGPTIQYLHKTVKDYIESPSIQERLQQALKPSFDPNLKLCAANLALLKVCDRETLRARHDITPGIGDKYVAIALRCMKQAAFVRKEHTNNMIQLLDDLDGALTLRHIVDGRDGIIERGAVSTLIGSHLAQDECFGGSFLSFAVKSDVVEYVKARTNQCCLVPNLVPELTSPRRFLWNKPKSWIRPLNRSTDSSFWPLLLDAISSKFPNVSMVGVLLDKGADPNYVLSGGIRTSTIWEDTLTRIIVEFSPLSLPPGTGAAWGEIARLMINHGAAVNRKVIESALEGLKLVFNSTLGTEKDRVKEMFYRALKRMKRDNTATLELDPYSIERESEEEKIEKLLRASGFL